MATLFQPRTILPSGARRRVWLDKLAVLNAEGAVESIGTCMIVLLVILVVAGMVAENIYSHVFRLTAH